MSWLSIGKSFAAVDGGTLQKADSQAHGTNSENRVVLSLQTTEPDSRKRKRKKEKGDIKDKRKKMKRKHRHLKRSVQDAEEKTSLAVSNQSSNYLMSNISDNIVLDGAKSPVDGSEVYSESNFESSSDSDDELQRKMHTQNINLNKVDVIYMPNGRIALLEKERDVGTSFFSWSIDKSRDREICLFMDVSSSSMKPRPKMILSIQHTSHKHQILKNAFASRFCNSLSDWDANKWEIRCNTASAKPGKSKRWRYFTKSYSSSFSDSQLKRLYFNQSSIFNPTKSSPNSGVEAAGAGKALAVSQFGFVAAPPADDGIAVGELDSCGRAVVSTDSDLAFQRVRIIRQRYSLSELKKGPPDLFLDCLLQQQTLQRCTLLSSSGSESLSLRSIRGHHAWGADKVVAERMVSLIDEYRREGGAGKDHPSLHLLHWKLKINFSTLDEVERLCKETVASSCPGSFELRLVQWGNLTQSNSTHSVRTLRELHLKLLREIENDMKNAQAARMISENVMLALSRNGHADILPLRLQEDIRDAQMDATLRLILLERQLGNTERAIALVQGLLELNLDVSGSGSGDPMMEFGAFWESEYPRIGEDFCTLMTSATTLPGTDIRTGVAHYQAGYSNWLQRKNLVDAAVVSLPSDYGPSVLLQMEKTANIESSVLKILSGDDDLNQTILSSSPGEGIVIKESDFKEKGESEIVASSSAALADPVGLDNEVDADDGMVYSRIHGYRIPIRQEDSLSSYRRVLGKLQAQHPAVDQEHDSEEAIAAGAGEPKGKRAAADGQTDIWHTWKAIIEEDRLLQVAKVDEKRGEELGYSALWGRDFLLSSIQWRPLRALNNRNYILPSESSDMSNIELDRVAFFEDIKDFLFTLPLRDSARPEGKDDIDNLTLGFSFRLHQRLVLRSLEGLGLLLPLSSCSHSLQRRQLNPHLQTDSLDAEFSPPLDIFAAHRNPAESGNTDAQWDPFRYQWQMLSNHQEVCLVSKALATKHKACFCFGYDSELNFIIRVVENILSVHMRKKLRKLTHQFAIQLRCLLMKLLVDRWELQLGLSTPSTNAFAFTADVEWVRSYCRDLIEGTVSLEEDGPLGSFLVWSSYIQAERRINRAVKSHGVGSDSSAALKVIDKVFKAVGQQQRTGGAHLSDGFVKFNRVALEIVVETISASMKSFPSTKSKDHAPQHEAAFAGLQMVMCLVSSSAVPVEGYKEIRVQSHYSSFFKSLGSNREKSKAERPAKSADVTFMITKLQLRIAELLEFARKQVEEVRRNRLTEAAISACRMPMSPCHLIDSTPETFDLISILTWTQFLAVLFVENDGEGGVGKITRSKVAFAANIADDCIANLMTLIRGIILEPSSRGVAEAEFLSSTVWDSQVEVGLVLLLERLHLTRLMILQTALEWMPSCIYSAQNDRRRLLHSFREAVTAGLKDFPLNVSLLHCLVFSSALWWEGSSSLEGLLVTRTYFSSLEKRKLWGGGLMLVEKVQALSLLIELANRSSSIRPTSPHIGPTGVWVTITGDNCSHWSDESYGSIVGLLEQFVSAASRDSLYGGDGGLWMLYFRLLSVRRAKGPHRLVATPKVARGLFYRALSSSTAGKAAWMAAMGPLRGAFSTKELKAIQESMEDSGLWIRKI